MIIEDRRDAETDRVALPRSATAVVTAGRCSAERALLLLVGGLGGGRLAPLPGRPRRCGHRATEQDVCPDVRVAAVRASDSKITVTLAGDDDGV